MNKKTSFVLSMVVLGSLFWTGVVSAEEYTKGHEALEVWDGEGFAATPLWVKIWVGFLISTFAVGLIFFAWTKPIARWAAGGFLVSGLSGEFIFSALGLPFLAGSIAIMHLVGWTPVLILLLKQKPFLKPDEGRWYRIWSGVMTGAILFSFIFDIRDAAVYINHFGGLS